MVQVTSLECRGCISASTSLSLSIEGVCSELVHSLCFRFSRGGVARVSTGHLSLICLTYRPSKTRLLVPSTQTRQRRERGRKREGILAHTWRINLLCARRKSFVLSAHLTHNSCVLPRMYMTPSKSTAREPPACRAIPCGRLHHCEMPSERVDY